MFDISIRLRNDFPIAIILNRIRDDGFEIIS